MTKMIIIMLIIDPPPTLFSFCLSALVTSRVEEEVRCPLGHFPCGNMSECLPQALQCNGNKDCPNGADEWRCGKMITDYRQQIFVKPEEKERKTGNKSTDLFLFHIIPHCFKAGSGHYDFRSFIGIRQTTLYDMKWVAHKIYCS